MNTKLLLKSKSTPPDMGDPVEVVDRSEQEYDRGSFPRSRDHEGWSVDLDA